jgi:peptidoglycan hydrolase-like protein with peptidoglycan-binding domain
MKDRRTESSSQFPPFIGPHRGLVAYSALAALVALGACVDDSIDESADEDSALEESTDLPGTAELEIGDHGPMVAAAHEYLRRYGYFPNSELRAHYPGWTPVVDVEPDDPELFGLALEEALLAYQRQHSLPTTGRLDAATQQLMAQPRCGFPDYHATSSLTTAVAGHGSSAGTGADLSANPLEPSPYQLSGYAWPIAELKYGFGPLSGDAGAQFQRDAVIAAMNSWSAVAPIAWAQRTNPDVLVSFVPIAHGDGHDFVGEFAHAFYPWSCGPFSCASLAGDVHFNDESWTWGTGNGGSVQDVQSTALHELGHALGLGHSADPSASMYASKPLGAIKRDLAQDDINGILAIYPTYRDLRTFDPWWYLQLNGDVSSAYGGNQTSASFHWLNPGRHEGRRASPVFDVIYYLQAHPDLAAAFGNNYAEAHWHWREHGLAEGRVASPAFHAPYYLSVHPDLSAAFTSTGYAAALDHWMRHGLAEGRRASSNFDPVYYLQANPDVAAYYGANNYAGGLVHWLLVGMNEGRPAVP